VAAEAAAGLLLEHPEHDEHLPAMCEGKLGNEKPPPGREAVAVKSGAGSAPHGAFPPGSAKLGTTAVMTRPCTWER
jgi:hypothetical protein